MHTMLVLLALAAVAMFGISLVMSLRGREIVSSPSGSSRASPKRYFGWFGSIFAPAHPIRAVIATALVLVAVLCVTSLFIHTDSMTGSRDTAAMTTAAIVATVPTDSVNNEVPGGIYGALAIAILFGTAFVMHHLNLSGTGSANFTIGASTFGRLRQSGLRSFVMGAIKTTCTGTFGWKRRFDASHPIRAVMHAATRFSGSVSFRAPSASFVT